MGRLRERVEGVQGKALNGRDATVLQGGAEPGAVVATVGDQLTGWRQAREHDGGLPVVAGLSFGEQQHDRPSPAVTGGVELGVQPALGSPEKAGKSPFLSKLAAVRCAFRWVLSIMMRSGGPPSEASAAKMRSNTPMRLQRMKRL